MFWQSFSCCHNAVINMKPCTFNQVMQLALWELNNISNIKQTLIPSIVWIMFIATLTLPGCLCIIALPWLVGLAVSLPICIRLVIAIKVSNMWSLVRELIHIPFTPWLKWSVFMTWDLKMRLIISIHIPWGKIAGLVSSVIMWFTVAVAFLLSLGTIIVWWKWRSEVIVWLKRGSIGAR